MFFVCILALLLGFEERSFSFFFGFWRQRFVPAYYLFGTIGGTGYNALPFPAVLVDIDIWGMRIMVL